MIAELDYLVATRHGVEAEVAVLSELSSGAWEPKMMGYTLGSSNGSWSVGDLTYALQWFADGVAIPGATAATYKITAADVSKQLSIRVTASKDGYESGIATSVLTEAIQPGTVVNVVAPTIYGADKVGQAVGVNAGSWTPGAVEWSYRWFADGVLLAGVTTKTFVPGAALFGKSLKAEVTGGKAGYASATGVSATSTPLTCTLARVGSASAPASRYPAGLGVGQRSLAGGRTLDVWTGMTMTQPCSISMV